MSLSFKRSGYCVLGQVMVILGLNLLIDFHICYPSTHTHVNALTHIYSRVHPRVSVSICYKTKHVPNIGALYKYLYRVDTCHFVGKAKLY
jgi:hypothetical protein